VNGEEYWLGSYRLVEALLFVDLAPMGNSYHDYGNDLILNLVEYSIVSLSNPVLLFAR